MQCVGNNHSLLKQRKQGTG